MPASIEFTSRLFGQYIEMHAIVMRQTLAFAETMNDGLFSYFKAALKCSRDACCGIAQASSLK